MKSLSRFTCCLSLLCALRIGAAAQDSPSLLDATPPVPNGFDKFFDAAERYLPGEESLSTTDAGVAADEKLQRQHSSVLHNRRTLYALHEGLKMAVLHPPVQVFADDYGDYATFRDLGALLKEESAVDAADGKPVDAMDCALDCIEFGVVMTRGGPLRASLAGRDIENLGRRDIAPIVEKLKPAELRAAAARLETIETLRPPLADAIREQKVAALNLTKLAFEELDWNQIVEETVKLDGSHFTDDEKATLSIIGQAEVQSNLSRTLEAALVGADGPYLPAKAAIPRAADPWSRLWTDALTPPSFRTDYEKARAQDRLLQVALQLRATRLENGAYPATIDLPTDPFAGGEKLHYHRAGDSYLLYSVGPDAKDDGGATSDLLAPTFPL